MNQIWEMSVTSTPMPEFEGSLGEETKKAPANLPAPHQTQSQENL